jgi:hypothetical protein
LQRWAEAATDASHYLDRHAYAYGAHLLRARSYQMARRFADALGDCTAMIDQHPRNPRLHRMRAACHETLGRAAQAKADPEQAVALSPHEPRNLRVPYHPRHRVVIGTEIVCPSKPLLYPPRQMAARGDRKSNTRCRRAGRGRP